MTYPIIVTHPGPFSEAFLQAWCASGRRVAEIWTSKPEKFGSLLQGASIRIRDTGPICDPLPDPHAQADALITFFSLRIIPQRLLDQFGPLAVNIHPALLPYYKGPVSRHALIKDGMADKYGGLTAHVLTQGIDEGPIIAQKPVLLGPKETIPVWEERLALAAAELMVTEVAHYLESDQKAAPQKPGSGCYRSRVEGEFVIDERKSLEEVRILLRQFRGGYVLCRPKGGFSKREKTFVNRFAKVLGPPSGTPAILRFSSIEMDISDARVKLLRPSQIDKLHAKIRHHTLASRARSIGRRAHL